MKSFTITSPSSFSGETDIPGDKSISHRAVMVSSISKGRAKVSGFLKSEDCMRTVTCFKSMGIDIDETPSGLIVEGRGLAGLKPPSDILYVGNSGTTIRLLLGILAGQPFKATLTGDESIGRRPMKRVMEPLVRMGASITGRDGDHTPITVQGGKLKPIEYDMPVASAQVKSAILLAGLFASGTTLVRESVPTRDHTERMLEHCGARIERRAGSISISGRHELAAQPIEVPGDISSASFVMAAACLIPGSDVFIRNVGVNPGRTGILDVLHRMGADIEVSDERMISGEPIADIRVKHSTLKGIKLSGAIIPRIIDEIPIIALLATQASGNTEISGAQELRVKESDRIATISSELNKFGADIKALPDGLVIKGGAKLKGAKCKSYSDHRIAMSCSIAGLIAKGATSIEDVECVETSFPGFSGIINKLAQSKCIQ